MPNGTSSKKSSAGNGSSKTEMCVGCNYPHAHCGCAHAVLANFLFGLGLLALLFAWISGSGGATLFNLSADHLYHDAIALMVAGIFFRRKY